MKRATPMKAGLRLELGLVLSLLSLLLIRSANALDDTLCTNPPQKDISGFWIWLPDSASYEQRNSYAYFRKSFAAQGELVIHIAADTWYEFYIDGKRINRGTSREDVAYKTFDTHTVMLKPGTHAFSVLVHHIGQVCAYAMKSRPGLFVEMITESGEKIISDGTWKAQPALAFQQYLPCMMSHFGFYEVCECEKIPPGWNESFFDDKSWYNAQVIGPAGSAPWLRMIPCDVPVLSSKWTSTNKVECIGTYQPGRYNETEKDLTVAVEVAARLRTKSIDRDTRLPLTLAQSKENEFMVADFGREVSGHLRLQVKNAKAGQKVDIGYDETLNAEGFPNPRRTYVHFADRFYLRQDQQEIEVFGARGFRYLLIDVAGGLGGLTISGIQLEERSYPLVNEGTFQCSDASLERLYQVGINTAKICMLDTWISDVARERVMWMDFYPETLSGVWGLGDTRLWRRSLLILAQNTCRQGALTGAIRSFAPIDYDPMLVSLTMYYMSSVSDYVQHSGNVETGRAIFPTLMKQFEILERFKTQEGLVNDKWPSWGTFLDWSAMDFGGISAGTNAIYLMTLRKTARLARYLQMPEEAARMEDQANRLAKIYHQYFWSDKEGMFVDAVYDGKASEVRSQFCNVFAIWAGVAEGEQATAIMKKMLDKNLLLPRTGGDYRLKPGFKHQVGGIVQIGTPGAGYRMADVLFRLGMTQQAVDYLKENWLPITRNGTFAEHFVEDANSTFCHGWGAAPVVLLPRYILGVRPVTLGWTEVEVVPQPGDLHWAKGTIPTPHGEIAVAWEKHAGKIELKVTLPEGIKQVKRYGKNAPLILE